MILHWIFQILLYILIFVLAICSFGIATTWILRIQEATTTVVPLIAKMYHYLYDMGAWVPGRSLGLGLAAAAGILASGFCVKVGRIILSLFTGGGGGAA